MSRRPDGGRRGVSARVDDGFSMVEVLIAMFVFAVLNVASLGFVMTSLSATALAKNDTVGKNLNQELLEQLRNLPYSLQDDVQQAPDLLDTYYTGTVVAAGSVDASGFVPAGGARDTAKGDPPAGPFFRRVLGEAPGYPGYSQRVTSQFLSDGVAVLAAPVFDAASDTNTGMPPSSTIRVRVTTLWTAGSKARSLTVESHITEGPVKTPRITMQARMTMLRVTGFLPGSQELVAEAGLVNLDGSSSNTAVAMAEAQAARAAVVTATGLQEGAGYALSAPPLEALADLSVGPRTLPASLTDPREAAAFSGTTVTGGSVTTEGGQPVVASEAAPLTSLVTGAGLGGSGDYFRATILPSSSARGLNGGPVLRANAPACGGDCRALAATGHLLSTDGAAHSATASLDGGVEGTIAVLPTPAWPSGLLAVTLEELSVVCRSKADATPVGEVTFVYRGTVTFPDVSVPGGYRTVTISSDEDTDPLAQIPLDTVVGEAADGTPLRLSHYIESWSSLSEASLAAATVVAADGSSASISVPGVFALNTVPLRDGDPLSTAGVQLGAASCTAVDIR